MSPVSQRRELKRKESLFLLMRQIVEKEFVRMKEGREDELRLYEATSKRVNEFEQAHFCLRVYPTHTIRSYCSNFPLFQTANWNKVRREIQDTNWVTGNRMAHTDNRFLRKR